VTMNVKRPTETIEDYLLLIHSMQREGDDVIGARVKERLGVSAPTTWATLKRMERDGIVTLGRSHEIELSPSGQAMAESVIRRHMLAERLLTDILKVDWAEVHNEAHRMEHAISPLIERQINNLLGNPSTCPHGNPIPGTHQQAQGKVFPLSRCREGDRVVINNIAEHAEEDADLMHFLERNRLLPDSYLLIEEVVLSNGTIMVSQETDGRRVVVGLSTAELVLVRMQP